MENGIAITKIVNFFGRCLDSITSQELLDKEGRRRETYSIQNGSKIANFDEMVQGLFHHSTFLRHQQHLNLEKFTKTDLNGHQLKIERVKL